VLRSMEPSSPSASPTTPAAQTLQGMTGSVADGQVLATWN
jgi:hypothetical protein